VGAAVFAAVICALAMKASAQVPAPLVVGPDRVGSTVAYRLTTEITGAGPASVQTLVLHWKVGQKVVVTLTSDGPATPYVATRAANGSLALDNLSEDDPAGQHIATLIGVLNRLGGFVATAPAGAPTWKTTLVVQPPSAPDAQSTSVPKALSILVVAKRVSDATGTALAASGSLDRTVMLPPSNGSSRGRRGGGGGTDDLFDASSAAKRINVTTTITVDAHFDADGILTTGSIVETTVAGDPSKKAQHEPQSDLDQLPPESQPSTRSWKIDRTP
jgi:hypothetical protein